MKGLVQWLSNFFPLIPWDLLPRNIIPRMIIAKVFLTRTYIRSIRSEFEDSTKAFRLLCIDATICLGAVSCNRARSIGTKSMNETTLGWIKPRISGIHCRLLRCQIFLSTTSSGKTLKYDLWRPRYWIAKSGYIMRE